MPPTRYPEKLAGVRRRGRELRRQRRLAQSIGALGSLGLAVVALGALPSIGSPGGEIAGHPTSTTGAAAPGTERPPAGEPVPEGSSPAGAAARRGATSTTVTGAGGSGSRGSSGAIAGSCRNSASPACGPLRWDPAPENAPLHVELRGPTTVLAGDELAVDVHAEDPDAPIDLATCPAAWDWDDGTTQANDPANPWAPCSSGGERYGPWDPPPPVPGRADRRLVHVFHEPGTYTFTFHAASENGPYSSAVTATLTITVVGLS